ncbi:asparagine synthase-related protein [Pelomonas sp. SE-A7]|uniref:asparagine synthase-related protein n=1 Tax=Pelomonas sp. SE-A7 TaxID=3054953 RepID=UPI00259CBF7A|nr:asparagine synthase-related protein [Pelomonas sp. SE-A7]MDM4764893.1 asparagine synthase-related protein [Pelomonas sp. SE-A7]
MTVFAGAYCLDAAARIPAALADDLRRNLRSRDDERGERQRYEAPGFCLESWDSGAFAERSWSEGPQGVLKLAGDPLLQDAPPSRAEQTARLGQALRQGNLELLAGCRGSFALVDYEPGKHALTLATDHIGLRSLYYAVQDGVLVFATAQRILENLGWLRRSLSPLGMAELSAFAFPLAERTPYREISILRECEVLSARSGKTRLQRYYDWSQAEPPPSTTELYQLFQQAVSLRAGQDRNVYSFLSGGMDSRSIVATLLEGDRHIEALNFSASASQDQIFAQQLAATIGPRLSLHCLAGGNFPNFSFLALAAKTGLEQRESLDVDRRQFIWSGDGGSVGLGHVYMDEAMLDIAEQQGLDAATRYFMTFNRIALPTKAMSRLAARELPAQLHAAVLAEMQRYPRKDVGRQIYLFLLFNDQRRHLFKHFETIDQHGLELLTPFYDAAFLKAIAATPARQGILHRLYAEWFECLPAFARSTPWQTYPGHVPCPISSADVGSYQWAAKDSSHRVPLGERLSVAGKLVQALAAAKPSEAFSTTGVGLAALSHATGLRDCQHVLAVLETYARHVGLVNPGTA